MEHYAIDFGRLKNGTLIVELSRLGIEIERGSRGARWRTRAGYEWRRTNLRGGKPAALNYATRRSETMGRPAAADKGRTRAGEASGLVEIASREYAGQVTETQPWHGG